jgi:Arc/MetJ-type ribon-helix-helix transcriptional regulator
MNSSDEPMRVVSIKLPADLDQQLTEQARQRRTSRSGVVREALRALGRGHKRNAAQLAGDLVGKLRGGPRDLGSDGKYLKGYGR